MTNLSILNVIKLLISYKEGAIGDYQVLKYVVPEDVYFKFCKSNINTLWMHESSYEEGDIDEQLYNLLDDNLILYVAHLIERELECREIFPDSYPTDKWIIKETLNAMSCGYYW